MTNLSKERRERMLGFLDDLKKKNIDDDAALSAIHEIENALTEKKYGLVWEHHEERVNTMLQTHVPVFVEERELKIVSKEGEGFNFLLEGDNLHSLKLLEKTHKGKIDVIYIDPPYNTKNEGFTYNDAIVDKTDGYPHSKWLSFMAERLTIAQRLLADHGVIFISIDNREQAQLKLLCDEIFGEDNFIETYKWNKTSTPPSLSQKVRQKFEYIHCYEKSKNDIIFNVGLIDGEDAPLLNTGNAEKEILFRRNTVSFRVDGFFPRGKYHRVELLDDITVQNGRADRDFRVVGAFKWTQERLDKEVSEGTIFIVKTKKFSIRFKRKDKTFKKPTDLITKDECLVETNEQGKKELATLLPGNKMSYPKPTSLIKYLLKMNETNRVNKIILDFFAGSGTTGQAVELLNSEDGGDRKYILCTNNENNICKEITYERLKAIQKEFPHNLKYFKTDFVKKSEELEDYLYDYIIPLIELEFMTDLDEKRLFFIDDEEELQKSLRNINKNATVFIPEYIFLDEESAILAEEKNITLIRVPEYYFKSEIQESLTTKFGE